MNKIRELIRLKFSAKLSHRQIGRALNISAGTVSYYGQAARSAGLGWPLPNNLTDKALMALLEPVAKQLRQRSATKALPDWELVHKAKAQKHVTLHLLWQEYQKAHESRAYSYTQFSRLYRAWCKRQRVTMRMTHKAGEKGFIDYAGTTIPVYDRKTGEISFQSQLFVMALGLSQYTYVHASRSQQLPDWIDSHVKAFNFFGGVPSILVPDNLKSGITDSCQFEPEANPTYAELALHYDTTIIPARPRTPQDKSIAENAVLVSSRWIIARLAKQKFYSLNALNNAIAELLAALNRKPFQKRQGTRLEQFETLEKIALKPLPSTRFEMAEHKYQTVPPDYHIRIEGHYYSVPYHLTGERILCRYNQNTVEVLHDGQRVASHLRSFDKDQKTTISAHMPRSHQAYQQWSPQVFIEWAIQTGPGALNVAKHIIDTKKHPEQCSKMHFGLKRLCKQYGKSRLDLACRRALATNCIQFKSIRSILEIGLDQKPHVEKVKISASPLHMHVRGANYYQSL